MKLFKAVTQDRAGFGPIQAAGRKTIRSCLSRSWRGLSAALFLLILSGASPAQANGVNGTIASGQTVSGTITTTTGIDTYTFVINNNSGFMIDIGETGAHDSHYIPWMQVIRPNGTTYNYAYATYYAWLSAFSAANGTWTVKVERGDSPGTTGGSYALTLAEGPGANAVSGGNAGGTMEPGSSYSGTISRGNLDIFDFAGASSGSWTVTLNKTGGTGFQPYVYVMSPAGRTDGFTSPTPSSTLTHGSSTGNFTIAAVKEHTNVVS